MKKLKKIETPKLVQKTLFKIEKGVVISPISREIYNPLHDQLKGMAVGDSFSLGREDEKEFKRIMSSARGFGKKNKAEFSYRKTKENYRIWRTK